MSFFGRLANAASSAFGRPAKRPVCPYGASCYRKNPQHKRDEWHPSDPLQDDSDDKDDAAAAVTDATADAEEEAAALAPALAAPVRSRADSRSLESVSEETDEQKITPATESVGKRPALKRTATSRRKQQTATPSEDTPEAFRLRIASIVAAPSVVGDDGRAMPQPSSLTIDVQSPASVSAAESESPSPNKASMKMSAKQRRAKQKADEDAAAAEAKARAAAVEAAQAQTATAAQPPQRVPTTLAPLPPTLAHSTSKSGAGADNPLLASLHALFPTPLIPEFTEIRVSTCADARPDSGSFYIGRVRDGKVAGKDVRVNLVLATKNAKLSKMISRVHAKITWQRNLLPPAATAGRRKLTNASEASAPPAYSYLWQISDLGSVNGIFVNHVKVSSTSPHTLAPEDRITFGGGAGIAAGTYLKMKPEDAEFMFRFMCITKEGGASDDAALDDIREESDAQVAAATRPSKRTLSTATSTVPRPVLKRRKSDEMEDAIVREEREDEAEDEPPAALARPKSNVSMTGSDDGSEDGGDGEDRSEECATQNFGDDIDAPMDDGADGSGATQDYQDEDREHERAAAGEGATQDFGDGDDHAPADGMATQDGAGLYE